MSYAERLLNESAVILLEASPTESPILGHVRGVVPDESVVACSQPRFHAV
jgi:hypothetical protein